MSYDTLRCTIVGAVATVALNRPHVLNALNVQTLDELEAAFLALADDATVRAILLTGSGQKAFAAGADISEFHTADATTGTLKARRGQRAMDLVARCGKPVIALINGFALGGGCELALACTLRIAGESARLGQPEVKLGILPGYGGTQRLPRLVGESAALKLMLTGEMIGAAEALRIGLVDEVVPDDRLLARGEEIARSIVSVAPLAIRGCLEAVERGRDLALPDALAIEAQIFGRLCGTADKTEGTTAFLAKRQPVWSGQ